MSIIAIYVYSLSYYRIIKHIMEDLFDIHSVAVVGASENPVKLGNAIMQNLLSYGFQGTIYPVNPHAETILNLKVYPSLDAISDHIDCVIIVIPAPLVKGIVEECVKKGVELVIIESAGFRESGEEGLHMEEEIQQVIKGTNTRILGPNCLGYIDANRKIDTTFAANFPASGEVSFISQSGAVGTSFLDWVMGNGLGIHTFVSVGNKLDLNENIFLSLMKSEKVVGCYIEDVYDGKEFIRIGKEMNKKRPVVLLKPGVSDAAVKAIASHTGALAGEHAVFSTVCKQYGYSEVSTLGAMFNTIKAFAWTGIPKGNAIAIVTNAGGPAVITTDLIGQYGMRIADLSDETKEVIEHALPEGSHIHNPVDLIGDALSERYRVGIEALMKDEGVDAVIVLLTPQLMTEIETTAKVIGEMKKYDKPILASFIGGSLVEKGIEVLTSEKIPAFQFPEQAVEVLAAMVSYGEYCNGDESEDPLFIPISDEDKAEIEAIYTEAKEHHQDALSPENAELLAKKYAIPVPLAYSVNSCDEAIAQAASLEYPLVMKIASPFLMHKSDMNAVITYIDSVEGIQKAYATLTDIIEKNQIQDAHIQIQAMIVGGVQILIGTHRDEKFGPVLVYGEGGIYTQFRNDVVRRMLPVGQKEMETMIHQPKIDILIEGVRGEKARDVSAIVHTLAAAQSMAMDFPWIDSIDINPFIVTSTGGYCVDIKIFIQ